MRIFNLLIVFMLVVIGCGTSDIEEELLQEDNIDSLDSLKCGPEEIIEKITNIPNTNAFGIVIGNNTYYPAYKRQYLRTYSTGAIESDYGHMGAAMADYWNPSGQYFRVVNGSDASVSITTDDHAIWKGCAAGVDGGCWFASTNCVSSVATNLSGKRMCLSWKIEMNWDSMYLYADTHDLRREDVVIAVAIHEVGHAYGLRHRSGTIMNAGVPIPGVGSLTWETLPRFDACQLASLAQFTPDESNNLSMGNAPAECQ